MDFLRRWMHRLLGRAPAEARRPSARLSIDSDAGTAGWFDTPSDANDTEHYRAAPPLGRDAIDSDPATAPWFHQARHVVAARDRVL